MSMPGPVPSTGLPDPVLDHIVYGVPDLARGVEQVEAQLGVRLQPGGRHPGWGTANYLLGLGPGVYFEVIGPNPEAPPAAQEKTQRLPFGLHHVTTPRVCTWAIRTSDIDTLVTSSRTAGYDPGPVEAMSRKRPDGSHLSWRLALPQDLHPRHAGLTPFPLDWGSTPHPSQHLDSPLRLRRLRAETPEPEALLADLRALGIVNTEKLVSVEKGAEARLIVELEGPGGVVELG